MQAEEKERELLGILDEEWDERLDTFLSRADPPDGDRVRQAVHEALAERGDTPLTVQVADVGGGTRSLDARGRVLAARASGSRCWSVIVADLTGRALRVDAEAARSRSAALFPQQRRLAVALQESLLPTPPTVDGLEAAARYAPGAADIEVGGDWFDLVDLGAGRTAIVIGDVMGRGLRASAVMELRAAVRAYAQLDLPPGEVLTLLDRVVGQLGESTVVTCLFGVFDPSAGDLRLASAGHLPPLLVSPAGDVVPLELDAEPPLGRTSRTTRRAASSSRPGTSWRSSPTASARSRERDVEDGVRQLSHHLAGRAEARLDDLADDLLEAMGTRDGHDDDTVLLLLRTTGADPGSDALVGALVDRGAMIPQPLSVTLSSGPTAAREGRRLLAEHVGRWRLGTPALDTASLVISELATNAMLHGAPPITVSLRPGNGVLFIEVADGGRYRPHRRVAGPLDEGGRGLELVQALSRQWGVRPRLGGKVVWAEIAMTDTRSVTLPVDTSTAGNVTPSPLLAHGQPHGPEHQ